MSITLEPMDERDRESAASFARSLYLEGGGSYAFALALNRSLDWPIFGLLGNGVIWHACVAPPDLLSALPTEKKYFDARGLLTEEELVRGIDALPESVQVRRVDKEWLKRNRNFSEGGVDRALRLAQALWPDLPWKTGPLVNYRKFLDGLERLSKEHGVYLRAPYPMGLPILYEAHGDEQGYKYIPQQNGTIAFDRKDN